MTCVAPARERGLKFLLMRILLNLHKVAPARERGLKSLGGSAPIVAERRSREGAWIEIRQQVEESQQSWVAPARERGLKSHNGRGDVLMTCVAPARERGLK